MSKFHGLNESLNEALRSTEFEGRQGRADLIEHCIETIYKFVKFERPEGQGLDGRDGPERQEIARLVDAAKDYRLEVLRDEANKTA